ncbi:N-acetylmuramoyl-L-alanine amidase [Nonomuraea sp. NPDC050556]|uniref:N-acetylmuramoyl-L-alanine amidase n=1 Tax=Nonomuraea sp. NPDC050556 TaxID=3364369 RepID=UPI00379CA3E3
MPLWVAVVLATSVLVSPAQPHGRQDDFRAAAREYGVPESVLLGVSYLSSRWDANGGQPSVSGGFGPMHLVDTEYAAPGLGLGLGEAGMDDARGDEARPLRQASLPAAVLPPSGGSATGEATVQAAARLTGLPPEVLRRDAAANIRGGAALLASYQLHADSDPAAWYGAVNRYGAFADEVYSLLRTGAARQVDDGTTVRLSPSPVAVPMRRAAPSPAECPVSLGCEWMPAAYKQFGKGDYGNHDRTMDGRRIDYIVIHDTEGSYRGVPTMVADPRYVSWHYTIRSRDGHVAQHVRTKDIAWHAGNWDVNSRSVGIEHEGFLAKGGTWYTEAMYRSSAKLVRYLADKYAVPLDRAHVIGHDNVPGTNAKTVPGMHEDPGPYWDWAHMFDLMGAPIKAARKGTSVIIRPAYEKNRPLFTGCSSKRPTCKPHGASTVWLRTEPKKDAPLVDDIGKRLGRDSTYSVYDHSARASTGQRYGVAEVRGDWTAIWYLGQKAWFYNPASAPTAVTARGPLVAPLTDNVRVYGRAYPEKSAYRGRAVYQRHAPLQYKLRLGQTYSLAYTLPGSYYRANTFDPAKHTLISGKLRYHQIQLGHRVMFVKARDVRVIP